MPADALSTDFDAAGQRFFTDVCSPSGLCRSLFPVRSFRRLESGRGHRQIGQFQHRTGRGGACYQRRKTAFAYSDEISLSALQDAAQATRAIASQGGRGIAPLLRQPSRARAADALYPALDPIADLADTEKVHLLERLEGYARALDPRVVEVMASLGEPGR